LKTKELKDMDVIKTSKILCRSVTVVFILGLSAFSFLGCASSGKGFRINIESGNSSNQKIRGLSEAETPFYPEDNQTAKELPEMTSDEYERLGDALLRKGNLHLAFFQYERSLKLNPNNIRVEYKKGLALVLGKKNEDAIAQFLKVLEKDSNYAPAYEGIGRAFFQKKEFGEAETYFKKAIELNPLLWRSHNFLGNIYDFQKRYERAAQEYTSALVVKPDKGLLYNNLGVSYFLAGKLEEAVEAFIEALAVKYTKTRVYNNLGLALSNLGQYSKALEAFKKGGGEARAYNNLGVIYLRQEKFEEAIRCFEKAIEIEPSFYARASENLKKARAGDGQL
jgi:tetratricopeptide (TPR) repeat protein